ncbi:hypothetical protein [Leuconostoc mesenteroides]|uniref:hypothetical protein n=1 Tax=Leuconostoc mesenteroides TaxID=1245 RepID=UPI001CBDBCDD|nr:hypothetical protein [Leuconostoc mesenteroides]MBZ1508859.1 hypothetical protein [Leuconostoc mesenteroides]MBZ1532777.1 hypothetical protein [Leuconostoc mesenteroides]
MAQVYKRPNMPESFKRPYITIDGDIVTLHYTIYGVTHESEFGSIKEANQYARDNNIDNLPNAEFYD